MISYVQRGGGGVKSPEQLAVEERQRAQAEFEASLPPAMLEPVVIRVALLRKRSAVWLRGCQAWSRGPQLVRCTLQCPLKLG